MNPQSTPDAHQQEFELVRKQAELLAEQLREEGRDLAARIVDGLHEHVAALKVDLEQVRADLAAAQAKRGRKPRVVKSSGGRERASAAGTINAGGKARHGVPPVTGTGIAAPKALQIHKHEYDAEGYCNRWDEVTKRSCGAKRKRKARAPKQTVIPGVNGGDGKPASEATS